VSGRILVESEGRLRRIRLDNAKKRNAMSLAMWQALPDVAALLSADDEARAVILCGAEGHFCAGADIGEFDRVFADAETTRAFNAAVQAGLNALSAIEKPVIAAIEGVCFGGGVSLALQADIRFADAKASFGITPAKLGLVYGEADTRRLVAAVGPARAKDLLFSGRRFDAAEALAIGLVERIANVAEAEDYARMLTEQSPFSIRATKRLINWLAAGEAGLSSAFETLTDEAVGGPDFSEGKAAFREGRKPIF
jgi:enoyl-CoA hydratase/carnithine racemase